MKQKFLNPDYHQFHISGLVTRRFTFASGIWTTTLLCLRGRSSMWGCPRRRWSTRPLRSSRWVQWPVTGCQWWPWWSWVSDQWPQGQETRSSSSWSLLTADRRLPSISSDTHSNVSFATHKCHSCDSSNGACLSRIWCSSLYEGRAPDPLPFLFPFYILKAVCKMVRYQIDGKL